MKSYYILAASLLIAFSAFAKDENIKTDPIGFRENKGQLVDQNDNKRNDILYYGSINQMSYYLKKDGISYQLYKKSEGSDDITIQRLDISWLGANTLTTVERAGKLIAKENYYNTPDGKEILAVESFETVRYKNIYQGIDLKYYHKEGSLKYDYIVKPYEDYKRIALKVEGADQITLNADGTISLQTPLGTITEGKPVAYQDGRAINTNWKLDGNILSFVVSDYDRSKELVIDPLVYHWLKNYGSYPGGTGFGAVQNDILTSATDNMGNVIVGGRYDNIPSMGNPAVVFMTKYDAAGSFIWDYQALNTAYFGSVEDIFVNNNTIYFCGATTAQNIATSGSYQVVLGGQTDAIIEKISSFGAVVWRSYYGGANTDIAKSCSVDGNGNLFIAGTTNSNNNISSVAAYQSVIGGANDGFLINMDTNGVRKWGTYFGGSGNEQVNSCASKNGQTVICGKTKSSNGISSGVVHQPNLIGANSNGFIAAFDTSGVIEWATYYGGDSTSIEDCSYDFITGEIYIAGGTTSATNISTTGSYQTNKSSGMDGFVGKFGDLGTIIWGTYYGDIGQDNISKLFINNNAIYIAGNTNSTTNISTTNSYNSSYLSIYNWYNTISNGFFSTMSLNGQQRLYGSYINVANNTTTITVSNNADVYLGGVKNQCYVCPSNYFLKLRYCNVSAPTITSSSGSFCLGAPPLLTTSTSASYYQWYRNDTAIVGANSQVFYPTVGGNYFLMIDSCPSGVSNIITLIQNPTPITTITKQNVPCYGASTAYVVVNASGGTPPYSYTWDNSANTTNSLNNLSVGTYISHVTDANGCVASDTTDIIQETTIAPSNPLAQVCAVTVDSTTGKNLIIWEKNGLVMAKDYNVYVEGSTAGQYNLIGTNSVTQFSTFLDNNSNPLQQSYSYKIAEVDSCGQELALSSFHKTIHLTANVGINGEVNLSWNPYEGKSYNTHYIMRSVNGSPFTLLNQLSSSMTSYSDLTPPTGNKVYRIDIDLPTTCNPQKTTSYNYISSNIVDLEATNVNDVKHTTIDLVPNPTTGIITIKGFEPATINLYDMVGKLLIQKKSTSILDLTTLPNAVYLIKLYDANGKLYHQQKVIKQ